MKEWENYAETTRFYFYFNTKNVTFSGDTVKVWHKAIPINEQTLIAIRERLIEAREESGITTDGYDDYSYTMSF